MVELVESMGDPECSEGVVGAMAKLLDGGQHRLLAARVEQGCGLIEQEQSCIAGERSSDGQALLLPTAPTTPSLLSGSPIDSTSSTTPTVPPAWKTAGSHPGPTEKNCAGNFNRLRGGGAEG